MNGRPTENRLSSVDLAVLPNGFSGSALQHERAIWNVVLPAQHLAIENNRFLTQMCARFSPSRSAAPWEEGADALVPANQR